MAAAASALFNPGMKQDFSTEFFAIATPRGRFNALALATTTTGHEVLSFEAGGGRCSNSEFSAYASHPNQSKTQQEQSGSGVGNVGIDKKIRR